MPLNCNKKQQIVATNSNQIGKQDPKLVAKTTRISKSDLNLASITIQTKGVTHESTTQQQ